VARDLYDSLGAATYVERCARELKATGLDVGNLPDPADPVLTAASDHHLQLTAQEGAVVELVAAGATNKEGARSLFVAGEDGAVPPHPGLPEDGNPLPQRTCGYVPGKGLTRDPACSDVSRCNVTRRLFDVGRVLGERHHRDVHEGEQRKVLQDLMKFVVRIDVED
jgi:hypothetical protein